MNLETLFSQFAEIQDTRSRSEKDEVLSEILASDNGDALRDLAKFVYDPYRVIYVRVTEDVLDFADKEATSLGSDLDVWGAFKSLLHLLEARAISGHEARRHVATFLATIPSDYREWFVAILNKDLKIGVGRKIIEKHISDVAPKFSVQLCPSKQWDGYTIPDGGWMVSPKIDGIRGIIGPFGNDLGGSLHGYRALSRNGLPLYNTEHILIELVGFANTFYRRNDVWPVFDGEFYTHGWELSSSITATQSKHTEAHRLQYHVFDIITYPEWVAGKCKAEAHFRDVMLGNILTYASDSIVHVPSIITVDPEEARMITQAYVDDGYEGAVLKGVGSFYEFRRSKAWVKFKPFVDEDLIVSGLELGWLDSAGRMYDDGDPRASGDQVVKSLIVDRQGVKTNVGSGLTHLQRRVFCASPEKVVGKTATVRYQRISEDGCLIFPRFKGIRTDK